MPLSSVPAHETVNVSLVWLGASALMPASGAVVSLRNFSAMRLAHLDPVGVVAERPDPGAAQAHPVDHVVAGFTAGPSSK